MNCRKAQRLVEGRYRRQRSESLELDLQQHLHDCTDCRVAQQRSARLQRLLSLKRYEQPDSHYFERFAGEFHQRLSAEMQDNGGWWSRWKTGLALPPFRAWSYGFATAAAISCSVAFWWTAFHPAAQQRLAANAAPDLLDSSQMVLPNSMSRPVPVPVYTPVHGFGTVSAGPPLVLSSFANSSLTDAPPYVLDRLTVSPVSYEVRGF